MVVQEVRHVDWGPPQECTQGPPQGLWDQEQGGRNVILRLARGLPPKKTVVWPLPEGNSTLLDWKVAAAIPTRRLRCKTSLSLQHFSADFDTAELDEDLAGESDMD